MMKRTVKAGGHLIGTVIALDLAPYDDVVLARLDSVIADTLTGKAFAGAGQNKSGWDVTAAHELVERLDVRGAVLPAAAYNGGRIARDDIYRLTGWKRSRSLRGFTRPIRRLTDELKTEGLLPQSATYPVEPEYEVSASGVASAFIMDAGVADAFQQAFADPRT